MYLVVMSKNTQGKKQVAAGVLGDGDQLGGQTKTTQATGRSLGWYISTLGKWYNGD